MFTDEAAGSYKKLVVSADKKRLLGAVLVGDAEDCGKLLQRAIPTPATSADLLLPAAAWGEKDGTVTNSERRVSRQRAFLPMPGEARPDWWAISEVAKRMGHAEAFSYASAHEVFVEHARLSGWAQDRAPRMFDLSGLAELDAVGYDRLEPVQWPLRAGQTQGVQRLFEDHEFPSALPNASIAIDTNANLPRLRYPG